MESYSEGVVAICKDDHLTKMAKYIKLKSYLKENKTIVIPGFSLKLRQLYVLSNMENLWGLELRLIVGTGDLCKKVESRATLSSWWAFTEPNN